MAKAVSLRRMVNFMIVMCFDVMCFDAVFYESKQRATLLNPAQSELCQQNGLGMCFQRMKWFQVCFIS